MIQILDTTLREGEQTTSVSFNTNQKIKIAKLLDQFGIDFIEAGHPAVSQKIKEDVKTIVNLNLNANIIGHARATKEDIDAVLECGCKWIGIFMGLNDLSLEHKYHITREQAEKRFLDALNYAKENNLKVRCSLEDGSRTNFNDWINFAKKAEEIGVDRISVIDTVGAMTPLRIFEFIKKIKQEIKTELHVHCHNDFGMAVANSLTAYEAGVICIDTTINGLGERAGIASLSTICAALNVFYGIKKYDLTLLPEISKLIEQYTKIKVSARQPIIGENVFTHKGGLHSSAVLENPETYELISPEVVNQKRKIVLGNMVGKKVLRKLNHKLPEEEINKIFYELKTRQG
ncbi:MAG: hypothetical protein M1355_02735 [Patescibacteria group bacterium]|nr:hypothetical protein [Patescibacteria group bacterium]